MSDLDGPGLYAQIVAETEEAMVQDEWCLMRWGKHYAQCDDFERAEADRLRRTPWGGGYTPRERPEAGRS